MNQHTVRVPSGHTYGPVGEEVLLRWASEGRIPADAILLDELGAETLAIDHPTLRPILRAPPTRPGPIAVAPPPDTGLTTLIPYTNPPALVGYYIAVASMIPGLAIVLGPIAILLGVAGLKKHRAEPRCKGTAHAIVAIVLGTLTALGNVAAIVLMVLATSR